MRFARRCARSCSRRCSAQAARGPRRPAPPANGVGPSLTAASTDILTEPRDYDDWQTTLVDYMLTLGPKYRPKDLVSVRDGGVGGGGLIRAVVIDDLKAMAKAAEDNGTPLVAWSPFRGYKQQVALFNGYAGWNAKKYTNFKDAITFSARPGHSEHQTGLTIDFVAVGDTGSRATGRSPGPARMRRTPGSTLVMSYPKARTSRLLPLRPWHYRYVGRECREDHDSGDDSRVPVGELHPGGSCLRGPPGPKL